MKAILSVPLVLMVTTLHSQVPDLVTLRDPNGAVVNGTTLVVQGSPQDISLEAEVSAELNGTTLRTINLLRRELGVVAGSQDQVDWNVNMYLPLNSGAYPTWVSPDPAVMAPQDTVWLQASYLPNGTAGSRCFRYVWYDVAMPSDSSWVVICFDTQSGTSVPELAHGALMRVHPNPVLDGEVTLTGAEGLDEAGTQVVLYNALGERQEVPWSCMGRRSATLRTAGLAPGPWVVALERSGRSRSTCRLVVVR